MVILLLGHSVPIKPSTFNNCSIPKILVILEFEEGQKLAIFRFNG